MKLGYTLADATRRRGAYPSRLNRITVNAGESSRRLGTMDGPALCDDSYPSPGTSMSSAAAFRSNRRRFSSFSRESAAR